MRYFISFIASCYNCVGSGVIRGRTCNRCHGSGIEPGS